MDPIVLGAWPKTLHIERNGTARLGELVARVGSRALVVCGKTIGSGPVMELLRTGLGSRLAGVYDGVGIHTPLHTVLDGAAAFAACGADVIVSVGGGSATDTGKAVAIYAGGAGLDPFRLDAGANRTGPRERLPATTAPHITVPTVPGAGNVLLPTAGVLDTVTRRKMLFDDPLLIPAISLIDAELLVHCGPELTAVTGLRSIVGSIEALYAKRRNPFTTSVALESIRMMTNALPASLKRPDDVDAREMSMYAAIMGTLASMNAGVSAVHAVGLIIGGRYNIAHGIPHAILLPTVMRAFGSDLEPLRSELERALAATPGEDAGAAFERLARDAHLPVRLRDLHVRPDDFPQIAEESAVLPIMQFAPRPVDTAEIQQWLKALW